MRPVTLAPSSLAMSSIFAPGLRRRMSSFRSTLPLGTEGLAGRTDCVAFSIVVRKTKSFGLVLVAGTKAKFRSRSSKCSASPDGTVAAGREEAMQHGEEDGPLDRELEATAMQQGHQDLVDRAGLPESLEDQIGRASCRERG